MQVAPIRSPLDMQRAQARLTMLRACAPGSEEELEYAAIRDALEHYRCVTDVFSAAPDPSRSSEPERRRA